MKIIHEIDITNDNVIDIYFVDEVTGKRLDYTVEEFLESIRELIGKK